MIVSSALSLMLTLGGALVPPVGCSVVAVETDGRSVATCIDPHTWFVFDPHLTRHGLWSLTHDPPPELTALRARSDAGEAGGSEALLTEPSPPPAAR